MAGGGWNMLGRRHARKFMRLCGDWVQADGSLGCGGLWAWGEWEPQSRLPGRLSGSAARGYPQYLWDPCYVIPDAGCGGGVAQHRPVHLR